MYELTIRFNNGRTKTIEDPKDVYISNVMHLFYNVVIISQDERKTCIGKCNNYEIAVEAVENIRDAIELEESSVEVEGIN